MATLHQSHFLLSSSFNITKLPLPSSSESLTMCRIRLEGGGKRRHLLLQFGEHPMVDRALTMLIALAFSS